MTDQSNPDQQIGDFGAYNSFKNRIGTLFCNVVNGVNGVISSKCGDLAIAREHNGSITLSKRAAELLTGIVQSPTRDAAEGADKNSVADSTGEKAGAPGASKGAGGHSRGDLTPVSTLSSATPQPEPDAIFCDEKIIRRFFDDGADGNRARRALDRIMAALTAPVPSPDALTVAERREVDDNIRGALIDEGKHVAVPSPDGTTPINIIRSLGPPDPSDEEFEQGWAACQHAVDSVLCDAYSASALATGAAEPVAFDPTNHHNALKCPYCNPQGLSFATPPVREDLEARQLLDNLENACDRLCETRPQAAYDAMIAGGQKDLLWELDQARRAARDFLSLPVQPGAGEREAWQSIETAPRDGTRVLATGGGLASEIEIVSYNERVGCWDAPNDTLDDRDDEPQGYSRPKLWQALPSLSRQAPQSSREG